MKIISFCFLSLIKTRWHRDVERTAFNCTHKTGRSLRFILLQKLNLLSLLQRQLLSPTFAASSIKLLSGAVSVKDILGTDDFMLFVVFQ